MAKLEINNIYQMDCFEGIKLLDDNSIDVCFTSPPYNDVRHHKYEFYDDAQKDYFNYITTITDEMLRVSRRIVIFNIQMTHFNKPDVLKFFGYYADKIEGIVIWEKTNPQPSSSMDENSFAVINSYEFFIVINKNGGGVV